MWEAGVAARLSRWVTDDPPRRPSGLSPATTERTHIELSGYFRSQAQWRWFKAKRYPADQRNEQSARALDALAGYLEDSEEPELGGLLGALEPHLFEGAMLGGERTAREVSRYGYGYEVGASQHLSLLRDLVHLCAWDAYEHLREGADEGVSLAALNDFEIAAARAGVRFPKRYWLYRGVWSAAELEQAVQSYRAEATGPSRGLSHAA